MPLWCYCCACRCRARRSGTSGPPSPLQKEDSHSQHRAGLSNLTSCPGRRQDWGSRPWVQLWTQVLYGCQSKEQALPFLGLAILGLWEQRGGPDGLCAGTPHCCRAGPLMGSCPHLALTSAGRHVHTLLILADEPRFARCPGDEVYNGTICPPAMAPSRR